MAVPDVAAPQATEASSCTGWPSKVTPPQTIRVLRTKGGRVQTVDFRRYVAMVMASGEWPSWLRKATLEAGAVATKQYAWYYALKGHHRPGYRRNGQCYDVRDDVIDQLFRPERAKPTRKQQAAVDATWGLTLRKSGRFFLTGYRAGSAARCGADANGWKLYARSVEACAARGWSRRRIQDRYYQPVQFVWSKRLGPALRKPRMRLRSGNTIAEGAATVSWAPVSSRSDIAEYRLQHKVGRRSWRNVPLDARRATSATVRLATGAKNRFRVMAIDDEGQRGPWAYSRRRKAALRGPAGATLSAAVVPGTLVTLSASGGTAASTPGRVRIRTSARGLAFVASTGPRQGRARILIDGRRVATVDLERASRRDGKLVWARNFGRAKARRVTVKPVGDARVDFGGIYVLR